ncbi:class E sortase [Nakamurella deserti]|uniref:class E sortase n=1 Tax=Nakamurella deserti TaxID=2164074 RepID=UPI001F0BC0B6|nr:class E sortase [Nakamurella deserti]
MTTGQIQLDSPPPPPRRTGGFRDEPVRTTIRGIGQLFITCGVVLLLFVVYEVWVTDYFGAQKQEQVKESMEQRWAGGGATDVPPADAGEGGGDDGALAPPADAQVVDPAARVRTYDTTIGEGFANLDIPVFGADYNFTIVEGTTAEDLYGNPGHYDDTQYPGEIGNFAVAGHRVSKGAPFNALGTLNSCDALIVETQDEWFVYRVLPMAEEAAGWDPAARPQCAGVVPLTGAYEGVVGREIVDPSDYAQVLPVPHVNAAGPEALAAADQRLITLTTCHPQFSDRERMIIHGVLTKSYAKADGFLPPELSEVG